MGANRIKGITIEIGGDTTKLQTALKGANSQVKSTQQQLNKALNPLDSRLSIAIILRLEILFFLSSMHLRLLIWRSLHFYRALMSDSPLYVAKCKPRPAHGT